MQIGINQLVFIHVGKCGGTTIDEAFKKHITRLKKIHTSKVIVNPNEYYFTIVRNPIDRFISAYRYAYALSHQIEEAKGNTNTLEGGNLAPKLLERGGYDVIIKNAIKDYKTPNDFAENFINNPILKNIEHIKWGISEYFTPNVLEKIRKNLIFVGRQEYLNEDLDKFKSWINTPIEFTPLRVNRINEELRNKNQLSEKAIYNIKEFYRRDYEVIETFIKWGLLPNSYLNEL
jgi:hypothetical protein